MQIYANNTRQLLHWNFLHYITYVRTAQKQEQVLFKAQ